MKQQNCPDLEVILLVIAGTVFNPPLKKSPRKKVRRNSLTPSYIATLASKSLLARMVQARFGQLRVSGILPPRPGGAGTFPSLGRRSFD